MVNIQRFNPYDFDAVVNFLDLAITDTFNKEGIGHLIDAIKEEVDSKKKYLHTDINTNGKEVFFLVAKENNQAVGTIEYSPLSRLIIENTQGEFDGLCKVGTIYVHPSMQRNGIGSKMLIAMMEQLQARGVDFYCLDTGYNKALKVWTKMFGKPLYCLENYWGDGQHHSIWRISVKETINLLSNK